MNYARFSEWVAQRTEELVEMGVPRADAERAMMALECDAIACESRSRSERQFLIDFRELGSKAVSAKYGMTQQGAQKRRRRIIETTSIPGVVRAVA